MTHAVPLSLNAALAGRYRIERQLGEGGMATVYIAADLKHDRKVALKVLKPELAGALAAVALILGVDELMDMARTTVNLIGNCLATVFGAMGGRIRR